MIPGKKKLYILYILEILRDYSDESHILSQAEIVRKLNLIYGMECERKSVGANIDSLMDFGYDIIKNKRGCFLASREFEPSEIQFLIDAVFTSKSIDSKHSKELASKISSLLSIHQRKQYNYVYKSNELNRTDNKQIFYNIDIINEAIETNRQIIFNYNYYDINGNLSTRKEGKTYLVNPYFLVNSQGRYYLICNYDYFNDLANYKVEQITNIKMVENIIKPITKLNGFEKGFDISKYVNEHIYMLDGETIKAEIKLNSHFDTHYIYDWFSKNAKIYERQGNLIADITANESSIIYWCMQYCENVELVEPQKTKEKIIKMLNTITKKYKGEN